jgi:hypothetical protein
MFNDIPVSAKKLHWFDGTTRGWDGYTYVQRETQQMCTTCLRGASTEPPMKNILIVGIDANAIDFSGPNTPPEMTAEKLSAEIAATQQQFAAQGDHADVCAVKLEPSAAKKVTDQLVRSPYDCVVIGGGLRTDAAIETLERIVHAVHRHAPAAAIAFVDLPRNGVAAAARVLARDFAQGGLLAPSASIE